MKKLVVCLLVIFVSVGVCFADSDGWNSEGIGYEYTMEFGKNSTTTMQSVSVPIQCYQFWNDSDFGVFVAGNISFPISLLSSPSGSGTPWDFALNVELVTGLGYRYRVTNQFLVHAGIGFSLTEQSYWTSNYDVMGIDMGIGIDAGIKYDFSDAVGIDIGATAVWNFAQWQLIQVGSSMTSGFANNYNSIDIRPYICISLNYFSDYGWSQLGKPQRN